MRLLRSLCSLGLALLLLSALPATASARRVSHPCATPAAYHVDARDAHAVLFNIFSPTDPTGLDEYRYCLFSHPRSFPVLYKQQGPNFAATGVVGVKLAGTYAAYVTVSGGQGAPAPTLDAVVVDLVSHKQVAVPAPPQGLPLNSPYSYGGCCSTFALSSTGTFAGIGRLYVYSASTGGAEESTNYVLAYQFKTNTTSVLTSGAPGSLSDPQIFQCDASCSSSTPPVVGWTNSSGAHSFAALPSSG